MWHTPAMRTPILMMALIGTFAYEFQVSLPAMAKFTFGGDAGTYGIMTGAMGVGAIVGGLVVAGKVRYGLDSLVRVSFFFGVTMALVAVAPTLPMAVLALVLTGAVSITFLARANTTLQLMADPAMRGRVMAMWTVAFLGSTPLGGPLVGFIGQTLGPRWGVAIGALACFGAALLGAWRSVAAREAEGGYRRFAGGGTGGNRNPAAIVSANQAARSS